MLPGRWVKFVAIGEKNLLRYRVKATTQHHFINMQLVGKLERFETLIFDVFF